MRQGRTTTRRSARCCARCPGEPPYPETMNGGAIAEIEALDPDAVLVKGDLTNLGTARSTPRSSRRTGSSASGCATCAATTTRCSTRRWRSRALRSRSTSAASRSRCSTPSSPASEQGQITREQLHWLDDVAGGTSGAVLVFGHHHLWDLDATERSGAYFGINPDDSEGFGHVVADHENIVGYFAGHTHRNRIRRSTKARQRAVRRGQLHQGLPGGVGRVPDLRARLHPGGAPHLGTRRARVDRAHPARCSPASTAPTRSAASTTAASPRPGSPSSFRGVLYAPLGGK